ncbi:MAG: lipoprotein-releasing ABC transporter ATP-binding protein LolD [Rhodocyclaceae bacterium]|nr:lipoprotein-releasing ABC transporter ATP-binding protein LolD [Rhodocyclaceae bacterium]MBX3667804.1 lipoprotein-releasing ABC transporter ATP-binding protein LolD [Rhodocyclaceae bacterium]
MSEAAGRAAVPVIEARGLGKSFQAGANVVRVLESIDFTLRRREQVGILGRSGSGKSTLLHLLGGLDLPTSGSVLLQGQDVARASDAERGRLRNRALGFVYQFHHLLQEFSALDNVAMPLLIRRMVPQEARAHAADMLGKVGLAQRLQHRPGELSGGERQRTAIARALVTSPACLLADEPTGNLDRQTAEAVFELMLQINAELGTAIVVVTHDERLAQRLGQVRHIADGRLI